MTERAMRTHEPRSMLVTGSAGFIGANFVHFVNAQHPDLRLVSLDALTYAGRREYLEGLPHPERHTFVHGNVCDATLVASLLREHAIDTVVHFAAESHVDRSIVGPDAFVQTNVVGTFTLLDAARRAWAGKTGVRFHHVSTDEVYGSLGKEDAPFTETTRYAPSSPYSASKAASDHLVHAYGHTYGLPVTMSNCSNNYGPRQNDEKFIPTVIRSALAGKPVPVYGDGSNRRDWLFVEDHVRAVDLVVRAGRDGRTYNVGGGFEAPNLEVAGTVCRILDEHRQEGAPHERLVRLVEDRPGHDWRYAVDSSRIASELGWRPRETFDTGIRKTVAWYLGQRR